MRRVVYTYSTEAWKRGFRRDGTLNAAIIVGSIDESRVPRIFKLARMGQAVRCEGEASSAVQSDCGDESEPLLSDGDSCNGSPNRVIYVGDATEESDGDDESLLLLQS